MKKPIVILTIILIIAIIGFCLGNYFICIRHTAVSSRELELDQDHLLNMYIFMDNKAAVKEFQTKRNQILKKLDRLIEEKKIKNLDNESFYKRYDEIASIIRDEINRNLEKGKVKEIQLGVVEKTALTPKQ